MIHELYIKNFLSFKDEYILSFEASADKTFEEQYCYEVKGGLRLLKFGVIYGPNASGKTNVLNCLEFLKEFILTHKEIKTHETGFTPFLLDQECIEDPGVLKLSFFIENTRYIYSLEITESIVVSEHLVYYPSKQPAVLFERNFDEKKGKSIIRFGNHLNLSQGSKRIIEGLTINNSSVLSAYARANVEKSLFDKVYQWFNEKFLHLVRPETDLFNRTSSLVIKDDSYKTFALDVLQKADFNISGIEIMEKEVDLTLQPAGGKDNLTVEEMDTVYSRPKVLKKEIVFAHKTQNTERLLPMKLESSGTRRLFGLSGVLKKLLEPSTFLMIDEMENSLHTELVAYFLRMFLLNSKNSQLLITTHNINFLAEDFLRRDTIWFVDKDENGASELYSLLDFKLHKNLSPFNAYKTGKLGARPITGSPIIFDHP